MPQLLTVQNLFALSDDRPRSLLGAFCAFLLVTKKQPGLSGLLFNEYLYSDGNFDE